MIWFCAALILISAIVGYGMWPKDQRSLKAVISTGLIIGSLAMIGVFITQMWPQKHIEIKEIQKKYVDPPKIVYKDRIVYRLPDSEVAPVDVKGACGGKLPIQIVHMNVVDADKDSRMTWITGTPIGSKVKITCGQPGAYSNMWKEGDIVQFIRGEPQ